MAAETRTRRSSRTAREKEGKNGPEFCLQIRAICNIALGLDNLDLSYAMIGLTSQPDPVATLHASFSKQAGEHVSLRIDQRPLHPLLLV